MPLSRSLTRTLTTAGALTGLGAAFLAGTTYAGSGPDPRSDTRPVAFGGDLRTPEDCDELLDSYVDRALDVVGPWGWSGPLDVALPLASDSAAAAESAAGSANAGPAPVRSESSSTGTNVQESAVDEPDVVKTDGARLFRVEGDDLVVLDVTGDEVEELGSVDLSFEGGELLLAGDTVVAVSTGADRTELASVDVSDPSEPQVNRSATYDAGLVTARLHDGVVRLVLRGGLPDLDFTEPDWGTSDREAMRDNEDAVRDSDIEDWLPTVSYDGGDEQPLLGCGQVAVPDDEDQSVGTLAVVGFDPAAPDAPSSTGLAVDTDLVYASTDQLYVATTPGGGPVVNCWDCLDPRPAPEPLPLPDGGFLPDDLGQVFPRWLTPRSGDTANSTTRGSEGPVTHLYAFDLDDLDTDFAAAGTVDGHLQDRWSVDAVGGSLRVAVGTGSFSTGANSVVTFRQDGERLVEAGRVDGLGVGEDIKSVRWFDDLAFVVTFREVDPLYAVDLSDPADPELLGELKVPGFSAYLHPLGGLRLLGLGEGPDAQGRWGAQAGLFDVSDLTDPRQLDVVGFGPESIAMATQDPRQLTWLADGRTVLTVLADWGGNGSASVAVLGVGDGELSERRVDVPDAAPTEVRLVPLPDGRVVLVTAQDASFFAL